METRTYSSRASKVVVAAGCIVFFGYMFIRRSVPPPRTFIDLFVWFILLGLVQYSRTLRRDVSIRPPSDALEHQRLRRSWATGAASLLIGFLGFGLIMAPLYSPSSSLRIQLIGLVLALVGVALRVVTDWLYAPFVVDAA